ncbi:MFS transporter [Candidatus Marinimicrobia bacterium MT.SAG.3]|nr:MFS transporter [Candidatus Marinimicrobia bacterium MT.SAG.3]
MDTAKKREIFGWVMYDFANSGYAVIILAAILPIYFSTLVPEGGAVFRFFGNEFTIASPSLWAYTLSFSMLIVALSAPVLGVIADYAGTKKKLLMGYTYVGSFFCALLFFVGDGEYLMAMILFIFANICFAGGGVFYNAFLPQIADKDEIDWVSGKGFGYGYIGGGILLVFDLLLITNHEWFGLESRALGTRISFLTVGIWWVVMSIPTFKYLKERKGLGLPQGEKYISFGFKKIFKTLKEIKQYKQLAKFLLAFVIYNDAIQTVIAMSTIFGKVEIGLGEGDLIGALLMTQFIALPGSLMFAKFAKKIGAKQAIIVSLIAWSGIVIYAYFLESALEFWILAGAVGLVLGGTQATSRSLFASFVPKENSAEFFGFFAISNKFASIMGPLTFAAMGQLFGSARASIVSLIVFLIIGLILLWQVDTEEGIRQSKRTV